VSARSIVVFDLGGVLVDWNPRYLYRKLFGRNDDAMEHFLANVCTPSWNSQQDAGRSFAEGCTLLKSQHPEQAELIDAWFARHGEMIAGPISGTVKILAELRGHEIPLYALSNWSAETFPTARRRLAFLQWFQGILLSGEVRLIKPDPRIFQMFTKTFAIDPCHAVYIDDLLPNVEAARAIGMTGILFNDPIGLRNELVKLGLLDSRTNIDLREVDSGDGDSGSAITPIRSSPEV
jgi:2-haloacid dehalogenase